MVDEEGNESSQELHFFYDSQSKPAFVEFEGECYRYIHSLQGDIVSIIDDAGNFIVEYKYNSWGKQTSDKNINATLGKLNPFRRRGYVWNEETGLYHLRNRYYSVEFIRFLTADKYISSSDMSLNRYCKNNPVVFSDPDGNRYVYDAIDSSKSPHRTKQEERSLAKRIAISTGKALVGLSRLVFLILPKLFLLKLLEELGLVDL